MPCMQCTDGKWKWGETGSCEFDSEEECRMAHPEHMDEKKSVKRGLFTAKKADSAELYLYDEIGESWFGGISAKTFSQQLADLGDIKTLDLHLNTPGGDVLEADAMYSLLNQHRATKNVFIDGLAASAGSLIAMVGDTISIAEHAKFMIHNPRGGLMVFDEADKIQAEANKLTEILNKFRDAMLLIYKGRTGKSIEELSKLVNAETWYIGQEAVDAGFADKIVPVKTVESRFAMLATFKHVPDSLKADQKQGIAELEEAAKIATPQLPKDEEELNRYRARFAALAAVSPYFRERNKELQRKLAKS